MEATQTAAAPSTPGLTDTQEPTNPSLWEDVLEVARGRRSVLTIGRRTINAPNRGRGFYPWPHPKGVAWAIKQYKGFGGNWRPKAAAWKKSTLYRLAHGAVTETLPGSVDHANMVGLHRIGTVQGRANNGKVFWEITAKGFRIIQAGLGQDLIRKMDDLLSGDYDPNKAREVGKWVEGNFRIQSPKTPRGTKKLKEQVNLLVWTLKNGDASRGPQVANDWADIKPQVGTLVSKFTDEGGTVVPKEMKVNGVTFINQAGFDESKLKKFGTSLAQIINSLTGWHAKALKGGVTVVLASPREFRGTATGKYRRSEDALYIRATPKVLKRGKGYASPEYIIVHELGHRFERFNPTGGVDWDQGQWHTTDYSRTQSMAGSESFAELFALSHFKLRGPWDYSIVEKFDGIMSGS